MSVTKQFPIAISCEFFPTTTVQGEEKLALARHKLTSLGCECYSVTHGAGGGTRRHTLRLVQSLCEEGIVPVMPHLTCICATKDMLTFLLDTYYSLGVRRLMALRGDIPKVGCTLGQYRTAADLVEFVRDRWGGEAHIAVAAYPEKHPHSRGEQSDLENFKRKCDVGANEAVTQYFYRVDAFLDFRDKAVDFGVNIPIIPGIMPISDYEQQMRFAKMTGITIPNKIRQGLEKYRDDHESLKKFGEDVIIRLCERLLAEGVPRMHFYSMNRAEPILSVIKNLGYSV